MNVYSETDVGRQRSENQDTISVTNFGDDTVIVTLADGMGGHAGGAEASKLAADAFEECIRNASRTRSLEDILRQATTEANDIVRERAHDDQELSNMGTTLVGGVLDGETVTLANVGDSRAYEIGPQMDQITTDQSLVQDLVDSGEIDPEDASDHPHSNVLSQAIGTDETVEPDIHRVSLEGSLLLCSDGLTSEVDDDTIAAIVRENDPKVAVQSLVDEANAAGGSDNISVILVSIDE